MMQIWIGIDPGLTGAVAWLTVTSKGIKPVVYDCPVLQERAGGKRDYEIAAMHKLLSTRGTTEVAIEWPSWAGLQSKQAAGSIARSCSIWETLCVLDRLPYHRIAPHKWKRDMGLQGKNKDASRAMAMRLWPGLREQLELKKHDGRAEALLLAEYLRRAG